MFEMVQTATSADAKDEDETWVDPHYFAPPGGDGPHWIYDHKIGTIYIMVHRDGEWRDEVETCEGKEIVQGPLLPPSPEQLASHAEHFERQRQIEFAEYDCDPLWPVLELHCARDERVPPPPAPVKRSRRKKGQPEPQPEVEVQVPEYEPPYSLLSGYYWMKLTADSAPRVALVFEGHWIPLGLEDWYHESLTEYPIVLFGPLIRPSKAEFRQRTSKTLLN